VAPTEAAAVRWQRALNQCPAAVQVVSLWGSQERRESGKATWMEPGVGQGGGVVLLTSRDSLLTVRNSVLLSCSDSCLAWHLLGLAPSWITQKLHCLSLSFITVQFKLLTLASLLPHHPSLAGRRRPHSSGRWLGGWSALIATVTAKIQTHRFISLHPEPSSSPQSVTDGAMDPSSVCWLLGPAAVRLSALKADLFLCLASPSHSLPSWGKKARQVA